MFIDLTCAESVASRSLIPEDGSYELPPAQDSDLVAAEYWDEHCVECGAPDCYETCEMFVKNPARCCSRFWGGMRPVRLSSGNIGVAVHFRRWGKMELFHKGNMTPFRIARKVTCIDQVLSGVVRVLNKVTNVLVPFGRRTLISAYRRARESLVMKKIRVDGCPNVWRIRCYSEEPSELFVSIVNNDGEIFLRKLNIAKGWNSWEFDIPVVSGEAYYRIYSIEGTPSDIIFSDLELLYVVPKSKPAKMVKCLIWDLDNTLWNGILADDGEDGIVVREDSVRLIKELDRRGIINSIASKNDWQPVEAALRHLGLLDYFVFPEVNWGPKSESVKRIALNMNIGIDSMAFVDDSIHERGEVSMHLPMVRVYSDTDLVKIESEPCFNPVVSLDSSRRRFTYLDEMKRRNAEIASGSCHLDFIKDCEIRICCLSVTKDSMRRCWELVNRTNQLTLAANRYTEEQFGALVENSKSFAITCSDKYGDYGIVGFIAVDSCSSEIEIREFVMSCRVAKKYCEQSVLLELAKKIGYDDGSVALGASVVPTGRNQALIEAFDMMPMKKVQVCDHIRYRMEIASLKNVDLFCNHVEFR